jgi:hypothetical protein
MGHHPFVLMEHNIRSSLAVVFVVVGDGDDDVH